MLLGAGLALAVRPVHPAVWVAAACFTIAGFAVGAGSVTVQTRPQTEYVVAPMELLPAPQTATAIPVLVPTPTPDDSIIVFHYTSVASAQAIATSGTYFSQIKGPMGFGMYLTNYDHQFGYSGYRLSQQELQFGLRSTPRSTWSSQSVDGYVKLRIPRRLLRHDGLQKTFYGMTARGGQYPDVSEDEQKAYNSIRKSLLFYALPTPGNGSKPGAIDIRQYVIEWGSTQFR